MYGTQRNPYDPVLHAIGEIEDIYGDVVGWERSTRKSLFKWGQDEGVNGTLQTIWGSPATNETYRSTNIIDSIVCTDNTFTGTVSYEGHTIDADNNLTFALGTVMMTGQTPVTITDANGDPRPLARITRLALANSTPLLVTDKVYGYASSETTVTAGVPQTDSAIHITVRGGQYRQSEKAATAIDNRSYFLVKSIDASIGAGKTTGAVEIYFQKRIVGNEFRTFIDPFFINVNNPTPAPRAFIRPLIIEPNSDIRVLAERTAGNELLTVTARISGIFLRKVNQ